MAFIEKVKAIVTGKSKTEREADAAAAKIIKSKALAAYRQEKAIQSVKVAKERARIDANKSIENYRQRAKSQGSSFWTTKPSSSASPFGGGMTSIIGNFGPPQRVARTPMQPRPRRMAVRRRMGPRRKARTSTKVVYRNMPMGDPGFRVI